MAAGCTRSGRRDRSRRWRTAAALARVARARAARVVGVVDLAVSVVVGAVATGGGCGRRDGAGVGCVPRVERRARTGTPETAACMLGLPGLGEQLVGMAAPVTVEEPHRGGAARDECDVEVEAALDDVAQQTAVAVDLVERGVALQLDLGSHGQQRRQARSWPGCRSTRCWSRARRSGPAAPAGCCSAGSCPRRSRP